jgi:indole-3-glycerol phosphate synthase
MEDILKRIMVRKAERLAEAKAVRPIAELERSLARGRRRAALGFRESLMRADRVNVIAEVKRASPSKGVIRDDLDSVEVGVAYSEAGAAAISVLTEEDFFLGSLDVLRELGRRVTTPLLRKDFVFDPYQIVEAAEAGADAVLLIAAALSAEELTALLALARSLEIDALVEVHTAHELEMVLDSRGDLVGVNNRNLRTFDVDIDTSLRLAAVAPDDVTLVAESGIEDRDTIARLRSAGFRAFLVGEHLMRAPHPGAALRELLR